MKILFCVSSMHGGGAERVAATLTSAWAEQGHDVTLLATYTGRGQCVYPLHRHVKLRWLADEPLMQHHARLRLLIKPFALRGLLRREHPDVVVSFLTNVNVAVLLASLGLGIPVIISERTHPGTAKNAGAFLRLLRRLMYRRASAVVVQTDDVARAVTERAPGIQRCVVIPNPLPPALPPARQEELQGERYVVAALGRLAEVKRFERLISAFAVLADRYPQWDLRIWGEGPMRSVLTAHVEQLALSSRVFLPGRTDAPWQALLQSHVFALTSRAEGFPNAMLEAMALGLPCVATDCPSGPRELSLDGQHALLVPTEDENALRHALERLMSDRALRETLGSGAAQSVRQRYSLPVILAQWQSVLETAVQTDKEAA